MRTRLLTLSCLVLLEVSAAASGQRPPDPPPPTDTTWSCCRNKIASSASGSPRWRSGSDTTSSIPTARHTTPWAGSPGTGHRLMPRRGSERYCTRAAAAHVLELDPRTKVACLLLEDPRTAIAAVPTPAQAARLDAEKSKHSSFMTRVHLDGLWTSASSGTRLYGLVGSHISLVDVGRLQVFGPPGVLLLSVPDYAGSRRVTLGYTWGLSVRLADVRLLGPAKDMTLFLNVSKVWMADGADERTAGGYKMMGLSIASRKKR